MKIEKIENVQFEIIIMEDGSEFRRYSDNEWYSIFQGKIIPVDIHMKPVLNILYKEFKNVQN